MIFSILLLTLAASVPVLAQDAGMSDVEIVEEALEGEKILFVPGEDVRYIPKAHGATTAKDSIVLQIHDFPMQQATMKSPDKANEKQPSKKDESILTFNFLYYIIQKYKLQDIID